MYKSLTRFLSLMQFYRSFNSWVKLPGSIQYRACQHGVSKKTTICLCTHLVLQICWVFSYPLRPLIQDQPYKQNMLNAQVQCMSAVHIITMRSLIPGQLYKQNNTLNAQVQCMPAVRIITMRPLIPGQLYKQNNRLNVQVHCMSAVRIVTMRPLIPGQFYKQNNMLNAQVQCMSARMHFYKSKCTAY